MKIRRAIWLGGIVWSMYKRSKRARVAMRRSTKAALKRAERAI